MKSYYILVTTCVLARESRWLRNACLSGALLMSAVAGIHGIVLASVHVDGAVDMDIYGAFHVCSIGLLSIPLALRLVKTSGKEMRKNHVIALWLGLIVAGRHSESVSIMGSNTNL